MLLAPTTSGSTRTELPSAQLLARFKRRVEQGLLTGRPHARSRYGIVRDAPDVLAFCAVGWWTAINVGLNDVVLRAGPDGRIDYRIAYWRWTAYAVGMGAALAAVFVPFLLFYDMRGYIERHPESMLPGGVELNLGVAWAMAIFWGFVWPWVLVAMHKRPVRKLMERLIAEVAASPPGATRAGPSARR